MIQKVFTLALITALLPISTFAQLSSENFRVGDASVGTGAISGSASSTSFGTGNGNNGIFIYDAPIAIDDQTESASQGTRVTRKGSGNTVLTASDNITICTENNGFGRVAIANVNVVMTLAALKPPAGFVASENSIIPPFIYNLGTGEQQFEGKNWTTNGQTLYANNCQQFLELYPSEKQSYLPDFSETFAPAAPPSPVPPLQQPVSICGDEIKTLGATTALDDRTLLELAYTTELFRSRNIEGGVTNTEEVLLQIFPVPVDEVVIKSYRFTELLTALSRLDDSEKLTTRLLESPQTTDYVAPAAKTRILEEAITALNSVVVPVTDPCTTYEPLISSTIIESLRRGTSTIVVSDIDARDVTFVGNRLRYEETLGWDTSPLELLTMPFEIVVSDRDGNTINVFEKPIQFTLFNPNVDALKDRLIVILPTKDGRQWFEVPFTTTENQLSFEAAAPGQFFIFILPEKVETEVEESGVISNSVFDLIDRVVMSSIGLVLAVLATLLLLISRRDKEEDTAESNV